MTKGKLLSRSHLVVTFLVSLMKNWEHTAAVYYSTVGKPWHLCGLGSNKWPGMSCISFLVGAWFCKCSLVSLGSSLILTGCSWLQLALLAQLEMLGAAFGVSLHGSCKKQQSNRDWLCKLHWEFLLCWEALCWLVERAFSALLLLLAAVYHILWIPVQCMCKISVRRTGSKPWRHLTH